MAKGRMYIDGQRVEFDGEQNVLAVIRKADPEFKVSLAGNWHPEIEAALYDYCIALDQAELLPKEITSAEQPKKGKKKADKEEPAA